MKLSIPCIPNWGKVGYIGIKLDMSKAYDMVELDFIEVDMRKMEFASRWIRLIMTCIRTVSYGIVVNGQPAGKIVPSRGIRQGDPMSPYIFIMCVEALSSLLHHAETSGCINGIPTSKRGPRLSHLLFVDEICYFVRQTLWNDAD
jgi:hypothetical protein